MAWQPRTRRLPKAAGIMPASAANTSRSPTDEAQYSHRVQGLCDCLLSSNRPSSVGVDTCKALHAVHEALSSLRERSQSMTGFRAAVARGALGGGRGLPWALAAVCRCLASGSEEWHGLLASRQAVLALEVSLPLLSSLEDDNSLGHAAAARAAATMPISALAAELLKSECLLQLLALLARRQPQPAQPEVSEDEQECLMEDQLSAKVGSLCIACLLRLGEHGVPTARVHQQLMSAPDVVVRGIGAVSSLVNRVQRCELYRLAQLPASSLDACLLPYGLTPRHCGTLLADVLAQLDGHDACRPSMVGAAADTLAALLLVRRLAQGAAPEQPSELRSAPLNTMCDLLRALLNGVRADEARRAGMPGAATAAGLPPPLLLRVHKLAQQCMALVRTPCRPEDASLEESQHLLGGLHTAAASILVELPGRAGGTSYGVVRLSSVCQALQAYQGGGDPCAIEAWAEALSVLLSLLSRAMRSTARSDSPSTGGSSSSVARNGDINHLPPSSLFCISQTLTAASRAVTALLCAAHACPDHAAAAPRASTLIKRLSKALRACSPPPPLPCDTPLQQPHGAGAAAVLHADVAAAVAIQLLPALTVGARQAAEAALGAADASEAAQFGAKRAVAAASDHQPVVEQLQAAVRACKRGLKGTAAAVMAVMMAAAGDERGLARSGLQRPWDRPCGSGRHVVPVLLALAGPAAVPELLAVTARCYRGCMTGQKRCGGWTMATIYDGGGGEQTSLPLRDLMARWAGKLAKAACACMQAVLCLSVAAVRVCCKEIRAASGREAADAGAVGRGATAAVAAEGCCIFVQDLLGSGLLRTLLEERLSQADGERTRTLLLLLPLLAHALGCIGACARSLAEAGLSWPLPWQPPTPPRQEHRQQVQPMGSCSASSPCCSRHHPPAPPCMSQTEQLLQRICCEGEAVAVALARVAHTQSSRAEAEASAAVQGVEDMAGLLRQAAFSIVVQCGAQGKRSGAKDEG